MRNKLVTLLVALIVLAGGYMAFLYARFYNNIREQNLQSPYKQNYFSLENPQKEGAIKYVALGDSLTAGVGSNNVESTFVYQTALNFSKQFGKVEVVNLGRPGATSNDLVAEQLTVAVGERPDYVTLLIGVNDVHNKVSVIDYKSRMSHILNELLTKTNTQIILINIPYLGSLDVLFFPLSNILDMRTKQFNKIIAEFVHSDRIKLIDLYTPLRQPFLENPSYYASDYFHPSVEGYLFWGRIINAD